MALVLEHAPLGVRRGARGERVVTVFKRLRRRRRCNDSASRRHRRRRRCLQAAATLRQCCRSPRQQLGSRGASHLISCARAERERERTNGSKKRKSGRDKREWEKKRARFWWRARFFSLLIFSFALCRGGTIKPSKRERKGGEQNASPTGGPAPARGTAAPRAVVVDTALHGPGISARRRGPGRHACRRQIRAGGKVADDGRAAFNDLAAAVDLDDVCDPLLRHRRRPRRGQPQHGRHRRALLLRVHAADRDLHCARVGVHEGALHGAAAGKGERREKEKREKTGRKNKRHRSSSPHPLSFSRFFFSLSLSLSHTHTPKKPNTFFLCRSGASSWASPSRPLPPRGPCSRPARGSGRASTRTSSSPASCPSCCSPAPSRSSGTSSAACSLPRCSWRGPACSWGPGSPRRSSGCRSRTTGPGRSACSSGRCSRRPTPSPSSRS